MVFIDGTIVWLVLIDFELIVGVTVLAVTVVIVVVVSFPVFVGVVVDGGYSLCINKGVSC